MIARILNFTPILEKQSIRVYFQTSTRNRQLDTPSVWPIDVISDCYLISVLLKKQKEMSCLSHLLNQLSMSFFTMEVCCHTPTHLSSPPPPPQLIILHDCQSSMCLCYGCGSLYCSALKSRTSSQVLDIEEFYRKSTSV